MLSLVICALLNIESSWVKDNFYRGDYYIIEKYNTYYEKRIETYISIAFL